MMIQKLNNLSKWINDTLFSSPNFKAYMSSFSFQFDLLRRQAGQEEKSGGEIRIQATTLEGLIKEQGPPAPVLANMVQKPINRSLSILASLSNCTCVWEIEYVISH